MQAFDQKTVGGRTRGAIDNVDYIDGLPGLVRHPMPTIVPHGAPLLVSGWAVDPTTGGPAQSVCLLLDRIRPHYARTAISRLEIMETQSTHEFVGFSYCLATGDLATGAHELSAFALGADGRWYESAAMGFRLYNAARKPAGKTSRNIRIGIEGVYDATLNRRLLEPGVPVRGDHWVLVEGWTLDEAAGAAAFSVAAVDAAGHFWSGPADVEREARASEFGAKSQRIGFEIAIPANVFARGTHALSVRAYDEGGCEFPASAPFAFAVVAPQRPFPLTARESRAQPPFAACVRALAPADAPASATSDAIFALPQDFEIAPSARIAVEGWAIDDHGNGADEVFVEIKPSDADVPPQRLFTKCALQNRAEACTPSPTAADAWFEWTLDAKVFRPGDYELALAVVQSGRRSYARAPLGTMRIGPGPQTTPLTKR